MLWGLTVRVYRPDGTIVAVESPRSGAVVRPPQVDYIVLPACEQQVALSIEPAGRGGRKAELVMGANQASMRFPISDANSLYLIEGA
jgi:hypothetical protein